MRLQLRRCSDCGQPIGNRDKFCPRCGTRQPRDPSSPCLAGLLRGTSVMAAAAQPASDFPNKPVRVNATFSPGGGTDPMARTIGQKLADVWGKPFVANNRAGASGVIGTEIVACAAPDGHTLLLAPARTPPAVVNRLSAEIGCVLSDGSTAQRMQSCGAEARPSTPQGLLRFMYDASATAHKVIAVAGIKAEW